MKANAKNTWLSDSLWLTLGIGLFYALFLGTRALGVPDEARYSEIGREMATTGHYLIPHLDGIKYFEKPSLFYWLQALSVKLFGLSEWSMRFWTAIFGVLGCLAVYGAGRSIFDRRSGIYASLILASSTLYYAMAHLVTLDMVTTFFLSACLLSFMVALEQAMGSKRRMLIYLSAIFAALAVLTKGLIGFVFPSMIIGVWIILRNDWQLLRKIYLPSALVIFFVVALPWHLLMAYAQPGWFYFYFIQQQILRYSTMYAHRYQPLWFFVPVIMVGFFPWVVFLVQAIKHHSGQLFSTKNQSLLLLLWAFLIFAFFSVSKSKLIPYIVPVMPPLAMLTAHYLAQFKLKQRHQTFGLKIAFLVLPTVGLLAFIALAVIALSQHTYNDPSVARIYLLLLAIMLLATTTIASLCFFFKNLGFALLALLLGTAVTLSTFNASAGYFDTRPIKSLALTMKPLLKPKDAVVSFDHYYQDLPFYLRRRVVIVNWVNELGFGMTLENVSAWVWSQSQFIHRWRDGSQRLFAVMRLKNYQQLQQQYPQAQWFVVTQNSRNIVLTNREITP